MSTKKQDTIYVFKVQLSFFNDTDDEDSPYRIIAVPKGATLHDFARIIVAGFGFDFDHAFGFYDNLNKWNNSKEAYEAFADMGEESRFPGVQKTAVENVFTKPGKKMLFLFDYGDEWHFFIEFMSVDEAAPDETYPKLLESVGDAPPQYEFTEDEFDDGTDMDDEEFYDDFDDDDIAAAEERIRKILGRPMEAELPAVSSATLKAYHTFLKKNLSFPFKALYYDENEDKERKISVTELLDFAKSPDETTGLLCGCAKGREKVVIPLAEIEPEESDPNFQMVDDYCFWYWEYL